jgi:hypothetical protein
MSPFSGHQGASWTPPQKKCKKYCFTTANNVDKPQQMLRNGNMHMDVRAQDWEKRRLERRDIRWIQSRVIDPFGRVLIRFEMPTLVLRKPQANCRIYGITSGTTA